MPANVETMFSVRETPWHGLGRIVMDAPASREGTLFSPLQNSPFPLHRNALHPLRKVALPLFSL